MSDKFASKMSKKNDYRPVIGISGGVDGVSRSVAAIMTQIRSAGAEPVFIGSHAARIGKGTAEDAVARDLARIDGLIVMGNDDIDPHEYLPGEKYMKHPETRVEVDEGRRDYEKAAIRQALEQGMPLLGICGGMQRMNVLDHKEHHGTLHQHVPDIVGDNHHMQTELPFVPVQVVKIVQGTRLAEIAAGITSVYTPDHQPMPGVVMENSFHHQAVDAVRDDFHVNATSADGIIEGIEPRPGSRYAGQFALGVQWHPEFGASELGPRIASAVTEAAREYAVKKDGARELPEQVSDSWEEAVKRRQDFTLRR